MKQNANNKEWPLVSILIASKDRRTDLERALESVHNLDYPKDRIEIVVVEETDQPSAPKGVEYFPIPRKNLGFGYARNQCVKHARYPLLAFTDDDCLLDPNWLKELVLALDEKAGGIAGAVEVKNRSGIGFCESILGFPGGGLKSVWRAQGKIVPTNQLSTCNCLFRKEVLEKVGLFQQNTRFSGEDYDLAQRVAAQFPCYYNPKAIIYHRPRGSFKTNFQWFVRRGRGEVNLIFLKTHSLAWQLFYILYTSFTLRLLILMVALSWVGISPAYTALFFFLAYYLLNLTRSFFQFKLGGTLATWFLTPLVKMTMDVGWDAGKALGFLKLLFKKEKQR